MITSLRGILLESEILRAVVECAGVGYEVHVPISTAESLPPIGSEVRLYIQHVIREDAQLLYGFASREERDFFRVVVEKVPGIGPKTTLNILSRLSLSTLKDAISRGDVKLLSDCPGVGKKTAERLVVELRDKVFSGGNASMPAASGGTGASSGGVAKTVQNDAIAALVGLGTKPVDADKAVRRAMEKLGADVSLEKLIRAALSGA